MRIRVLSLELGIRPCRTRLPFRFGISTMTEAPLLVATLRVGTEDGEAIGYAADLLVPKWFSKNPATSHEDDRAELAASARRAAQFIAARGEAPVGDHWLAAQRELVDVAREPLVAMFGLALVERAAIDAVCRASGQSVFGVLASNALGHEFGAVDPALDGWTPARLGEHRRRVRLRHTVGLGDALDASELSAGARQGDTHPCTLEEDIAAYGLTSFKVKVCGDRDTDEARLRRTAALLPEGSEVTLDGNEQYTDPAELADTLDALERGGGAERLLDGLISVEQPVSRKVTFDPGTAKGVARLAERAPVMIDEADATLDAFTRARELGYTGVSMKACKGVSRALLSRARIDASGSGFQSAEDLTNLPPWPLLQDLAVVSALGLAHVERNGHHYFRGPAHLTGPERAALVERHPDLFDADGLLRVEDGHLRLDSLDRPAFGTDVKADPAAPATPVP